MVRPVRGGGWTSSGVGKQGTGLQGCAAGEAQRLVGQARAALLAAG